MAKKSTVTIVETVNRRILVIRGKKVMLDADLAELYGVSTKELNQAVKRNAARFPADFMFRLSARERDEVVTNCDHLARLKYSRTLPFAFSGHGALMLGNVLKTPRAVEMSMLVVRAFVQLREMLATHKELAAALNELERRVAHHDKALAEVIDAIRQLMRAPEPSGTRIGLTADLGKRRKG